MSPIIQNIILGITLAAPVGPVSVEVIRRGLRNGFMAAFIVALGSAFGDFACLMVAYLGLSKFIAIPEVKMVIWILSSFLLVFLGIKTIYDSKKQNILEKKTSVKENKSAFFLGFALAFINPVTIIWWLGIFAVILGDSPDSSFTIMAFLSNATIILGVIIWFLLLSSFLNYGKKFINETILKWITITAGTGLICFGISFFYRAIITL